MCANMDTCCIILRFNNRAGQETRILFREKFWGFGIWLHSDAEWDEDFSGCFESKTVQERDRQTNRPRGLSSYLVQWIPISDSFRSDSNDLNLDKMNFLTTTSFGVHKQIKQVSLFWLKFRSHFGVGSSSPSLSNRSHMAVNWWFSVLWPVEHHLAMRNVACLGMQGCILSQGRWQATVLCSATRQGSLNPCPVVFPGQPQCTQHALMKQVLGAMM